MPPTRTRPSSSPARGTPRSSGSWPTSLSGRRHELMRHRRRNCVTSVLTCIKCVINCVTSVLTCVITVAGQECVITFEFACHKQWKTQSQFVCRGVDFASVPGYWRISSERSGHEGLPMSSNRCSFLFLVNRTVLILCTRSTDGGIYLQFTMCSTEVGTADIIVYIQCTVYITVQCTSQTNQCHSHEERSFQCLDNCRYVLKQTGNI